MLDSLSLLVITFVAMSLVSVIGVIMLHLVKNEKIRNGLLYFLSIWGMVIAYCNVRMIPGYMFGEILLALGLGSLGAAALLVKLCLKKNHSLTIAKWLATASVIIGMMDAFII